MSGSRQEGDSNWRVDLLALPSLTSLYAALIVAVLYGTMFLLTAHSWLLFFPLLLVALGLSVALVGLGPRWRIWRRSLTRGERSYPAIAGTLALRSAELRLPRAPDLMIEAGDGGIATFGSWLRTFVECGEATADRLEKALQDPATQADAEAALVHELHHIARRDHLWIGYARAALQSGFGVMLPATGLIVAGALLFERAVGRVLDSLSPFLRIYSDRFLYQQGVLPGADAPSGELTGYQLTVMGSLLGVLVIGVLSLALLLGLWRRLLRVREFYADAGAARQLGEVGPLMRAVISLAPPGGSRSPRRPSGLLRPVYALVSRNHPSLQQRLAALRDPSVVFGTPARAGLQIGLFLLIVQLFVHLAGGAMTSDNPMQPLVPAAFLLVTLYGYARVASGRYRTLEIAVVGALALAPSLLLYVCVVIGLGAIFFVSPALFEGGLATGGGALEAAGQGAQAPQSAPTVMVAMTALCGLMVPTMYGLVVVPAASFLWIARRMLRWYPLGRRGRGAGPWILGLLAGVFLLLWLEIVPSLATTMSAQFAELFSPLHLLALPVLLLGILAVVLALILGQVRLADRCVRCGRRLRGPYVPVRTCGACGELQNRWLLTDFRTDP